MTMVRYINIICCVQYIILLLVYHHPIKVSSYIPQRRLHTKIPTASHHSSIISKLYTSTLTSSTSTTTNTNISFKETSNELIVKLQQKTTANNRSNNINDLNEEINNLVKILIKSKSSFDPFKSINGPLFASVYFIGDTPLWEKIGARIVQNVKGQKYTLNSASEGTFSNYAEVLGTNLYLKAIGICKDEGPVTGSTVSSTTTTSSDNKSSNPLELAFASLFSSSTKSNSQYKPTPYDYTAEVTGASIVLFQKFSLDLTIEGTGIVRVLYADENLRIFLSPRATNVTKGGGDWESAGLVVVQVRVDLVYGDWIDVL